MLTFCQEKAIVLPLYREMEQEIGETVSELGDFKFEFLKL